MTRPALTCVVMLGIASACTKRTEAPAKQQVAEAEPVEATTQAAPLASAGDEASKVSGGESESESEGESGDGQGESGDGTGTESGEDEPDPERALVSSPSPAARWAKPIPPTRSRAAPDPTSVLGRLPKAEAVALVVDDKGLELVAVGPKGWRQRLYEGPTSLVSFEPTTGLVVFADAKSILAIDLMQARAEGEPPVPPPVVLAPRAEADADPSVLNLCVPGRERGWWSCQPKTPLASDVDPGPEYISVYWDDEPHAQWQPGSDWEDEDEPDPVDLELAGVAWLKARADRRAHFGALDAGRHSYWELEPLADVEWTEALSAGCLFFDEDCGKSVPLGVSGWEWVLVGNDRGDVFHAMYAVYDPAGRRWAPWASILAGKPAWIGHAELAATIEDLGAEHELLFDAGGRVFAPDSRERLCEWVFEAATGTTQQASGVRCFDAGGKVVGFMSVPVELGA